MREGEDCRRLQPELLLLAGNDLDVVEARRVWRHLAGCRRCRDEHARLLRARNALEFLQPSGAGGEAFFDRLHADVLQAVGQAPTPRPPRARSGWRTAAAAAFVFGLSLAITGWLRDGGSPEDALLERTALPSAAMPSVVHWPSNDPSSLLPLGYSQGLEAQRQLPLLFERVPPSEIPLDDPGPDERHR